MKAIALTTNWKQAAGAAFGLTALALTIGCNAAPQASGSVQAQVSPVMVNCEPHQRALVRPAVVNGAAVSQVDCVAVGPAAAAFAPTAAAAATPVSYAPAPYRSPRVMQPAAAEIGDAQVVPVATRTVRPVRTNQVVYDERPVRRTRSVSKSAIIIGSSAGAGAGVGAAIGGKKGALIGAAIGGGGATVWDQVTRRRQ
jgi:hypothetical protein